jgi:hypothetical protein
MAAYEKEREDSVGRRDNHNSPTPKTQHFCHAAGTGVSNPKRVHKVTKKLANDEF